LRKLLLRGKIVEMRESGFDNVIERKENIIDANKQYNQPNLAMVED